MENWPIDRNYSTRKEACIPDEEILKRYRGQVHEIRVSSNQDIGIHKLLDPMSTNDWDRLIQKTQTLLIPFLRKRGVTDNAAIIDRAEKLWFLHSMSDTQDAAKDGKLKSLLVEERNGLIVVIGRANKGINQLLGKDYLPVLTRQSRVAFLLMLWAHTRNHDYRDITMSIANSKAWIVGAKRLATSICNS